jgi:hypothetical protein
LAGGRVTSKVNERKAVVSERTLDYLEAAVVATLRHYGLDPQSDHVRRTIARHMTDLVKTDGSHMSGDVIDAEIVSDEPIFQPVPF